MSFRYLLVVFCFFLVGTVHSNPVIAEVVYRPTLSNTTPVKKKELRKRSYKKKFITKVDGEVGKKKSKSRGRWSWLLLLIGGLFLLIIGVMLFFLMLFPGPGQVVFLMVVLLFTIIPLHQALFAIPIGIIAWVRSVKKAKLFKEVHGKTIQEMKADLKQKVEEEQGALNAKDKKEYARHQLNIAELLVEIKALEAKDGNLKLNTKQINKKKLKIDKRKSQLKALNNSIPQGVNRLSNSTNR